MARRCPDRKLGISGLIDCWTYLCDFCAFAELGFVLESLSTHGLLTLDGFLILSSFFFLEVLLCFDLLLQRVVLPFSLQLVLVHLELLLLLRLRFESLPRFLALLCEKIMTTR